MGRMLEAMKRVAGQAAQENSTPAEAASEPPAEPVPDPARDSEEIPFIEVGGRDRAVDASPSVLTAPLPKKLQTRHPVLPSPRSPLLTEANKRGVTFRPAEPFMPQGTGRIAAEIIAYHDPCHAVSEQYRGLLAKIEANMPAAEKPVLGFMALVGGTDTTTTIVNLAVTWCMQSKQRVVMFDANRSALAGKVGVVPPANLGDLLRGKRALEEALVESPQQNLHVLAALAAEEMSPLLTDENIRWLMARLRERFDVVLVDGPAWESSRDPASFAAAMDAVYLVLDASEADIPAVRQATRALAQRGCRLGGQILCQ